MITMGEKIKKYRLEKNLSQPELAAKMDIEQSYLSKLENGKSLPSNDIFRTLLRTLEVSIDQMLEGIEVNTGQQKLLQIPDIERWYSYKKISFSNKQRNFLYLCVVIIALGVTAFYGGFSGKVFSNSQYEYFSYGTILSGEPNDIYENWSNLVSHEDKKVIRQKRLEIEQRKNPLYILLDEYRGSQFVQLKNNQKRLYKHHASRLITNPLNSFLELMGVFLFCLGFMGFLLERKIFNRQNL